jgi:hypothetical protein
MESNENNEENKFLKEGKKGEPETCRLVGKLKEAVLKGRPKQHLHKQTAARSRRPDSGGKQVGKSGCNT